MSATKPKVIIPDDDVIEARSQSEEERSPTWTAAAIEYHRDGDGFLIRMLSGITLGIPRVLVTEFDRIPTDILANVSIGLGGDSIQLKECDLDIALQGLLRDLFGLNSGQRNGGRARTAAKSLAAQRNGALGGRPRKVGPPVTPGMPSNLLGPLLHFSKAKVEMPATPVTEKLATRAELGSNSAINR